MKDVSRARFPIILLCSVVFHVGVLGLLYATWFYDAALKFGSFTLGDDGEARYKVAMLDRTKPLYLPKGFYAIEKPPDEIKKHEERPTTDDKRKAAKNEKEKKARDDKKDDEKGADDESQKGDKAADEAKPVANPQFGHIQANAFRPHLQNIFRAYEEGRITVSTFSVTVSCKALADGSLTNIELATSSGDELIDQTAVNIVKELGAMRALGPLSKLSSLSITLQKTPSDATLTAVGFASDPDVTQDFANQLSALKFAARFKMENADQTMLLNSVQIAESGNRISVSLALPASTAGDLMRHSFGSQAQARTGT